MFFTQITPDFIASNLDFLSHLHEAFAAFISALNANLFTFLMTPALLFTGVIYSFATAFVQFRALWWLRKKRVRNLLSTPQNRAKSELSNFESFVISSGARVGIGNIVGIALAVQTGGAGALVWMIIAAFFGSAMAFGECTLARVYARKASGGVAHYIRYGLAQPRLAVVFVLCLVLADSFGFNPLLAHTLNVELVGKFGFSPIFGAFLIALISAIFFRFGVKVSKFLVPIMLFGYLACALWVFFSAYDEFANIIKTALREAFNLQAGFGALLGGCVMVGVKQGLFSNEAGLGSAPNAASAAASKHACVQGIVQMCAVGFDLAICLASAFLVLSFVALSASAANATSAQELINAAFIYHFGELGAWLFYAFVLAFCLTSFYGNYYYSTRALGLFARVPRWFLPAAVAACFVGALLKAQLAWDLASTLMCFMALINLYAILRLLPVVREQIASFVTKYLSN